MRGDGDEDEMRRQLVRLNALLNQWRCRRGAGGGRGDGLELVRAEDVVPDWTNRERTGVSLEHCHWLAHKFRDEGFQPRREGRGRGGGHEIPVVVRESGDSR